MSNRRSLIALAAVTGLLGSFATSAAQPANVADVEVVRIVVQYGDLNLDTDSGLRQLQRRLVAAAREACGQPDARNLQLANRARACVDRAMALAVAEVGNARLVQLNAGRGNALGG